MLKDLIEERRKKLARLKSAGINPYPVRIKARTPIGDVRAKFAALPPELALDFAEDFIAAAKAAAPLAAPAQPQAPQPTAGAPAVPTLALASMSVSARRAPLATMTNKQKRDLLHERTGGASSGHGLARDWSK